MNGRSRKKSTYLRKQIGSAEAEHQIESVCRFYIKLGFETYLWSLKELAKRLKKRRGQQGLNI